MPETSIDEDHQPCTLEDEVAATLDPWIGCNISGEAHPERAKFPRQFKLWFGCMLSDGSHSSARLLRRRIRPSTNPLRGGAGKYQPREKPRTESDHHQRTHGLADHFGKPHSPT